MASLKRIIAPLLLVAILFLSWTSPLDAMSTEQVDAGLKRALVTFATARMLNAVISVAQGTDVAIEPAGIGVKFAPGEILDPINDLVEKFSTLMLFASIAFGIQKILITLGGHSVVSATLSAAVVLWSAWHLSGRHIPEWCTKLLLITLVLRFAVPLVTVGSNELFQQFLAKDYGQSQTVLESGAANVMNMAALDAQPQTQENRSLLDRWKEMAPNINVKERLAHIQDSAEQWTEKMINLMVVFLLQTLIFPLLLLWGLASFAKSLLVPLPPKIDYGKST
jgi:hypothetical protein